LILNESVAAWRVVGSRYAILTRSSNEILEFDKVIVCWGGVPNTSFMRADFANHLNASGVIHVDNYLRVEANLFAVGDATDAYVKRVPAAWAQVEIVLKNIINTLSGKPLEAYKHGTNAGMIMLGSTLVMLIVGGWCLMANRLGFGVKAKMEKNLMLEVGHTRGQDIDWNSQFEQLAAEYAAN
jgi:NADH dehydrogenase FAD-containing subunit